MKSKKPTIGIIGGEGKMGRWFTSFFKSRGCRSLICDIKTEVKLKDIAKNCDIVIISVPIRETEKIIKEIGPLMKKENLLCDFTSLKEKPLKKMLKYKKGAVLGMHPLFSPLSSSIKGERIVFCKGRSSKWVLFLKNLFEESGGEIIEMDSGKHDKQMATIQALTHFINISFINTVLKQKTEIESSLSTPLFKFQSMLSARILGGSPSLYSDIQIENIFFKKIISDFLKNSKELSVFVLKGKKEKYEMAFKKTKNDLVDFIPIAQNKTKEIFSLINDMPVDIYKSEKPSTKIKSDKKIVCLGPEGTFSHIAAERIFNIKKGIIMTSSIRDVFDTVYKSKAKVGVVPIENSTNGIVIETIDSFLDYPLFSIGSYKLHIKHNLLGRTDNIKKIKKVISHSQALLQCRKWLSDNIPNVVLDPQESSTKAIPLNSSPNVGFIGSMEAAKRYNLNILSKGIEDSKENVTEFYFISKIGDKKIEKKLKPKKTLLFVTIQDRPGVLSDILFAFAKNNINLTKLHSRKSQESDLIKKSWDYYFFIELDCLPDEKKFQLALKEIKKYSSVIRMFGRS